MQITLKARAKINLILDIVEKRDDGYHEVDMIMQKIDLYDEIFIKRIDEGIKIETNYQYLPTDERNIVYQAALLMKNKYNLKSGIYIHINKNIPIAAGLAGGSSDAATTIIGINKIFEIGLTTEEMMNVSVELGADVPFCFLNGAARARGIGNVLTPIKGLDDIWIVLTKPSLSVSTKEIYKNLLEKDYNEHPDVEGMIKALENGNIYEISDKLGNVLENVTFRMYSAVRRDKIRMKSYGAKGVLMSGSGPTIFGLFSKHKQAKAAFNNFKRFNKQTFLIKSKNEVVI